MKYALLKRFFWLAALALLWTACTDKKTEETKDDKPAESSANYEINDLTKQITDDPNNAALYHDRAELYEKRGDIEPAIRDAQKAAELDSNKASYHIYLAGLYEKRPYQRGAIESYEKAAKLDPKNKEIFLKLGILYFQVKDRNHSFENLNTALRLDPQLAEAFYYRGYNYREVKMPDKAIENFQRARELKPDYTDAYLQLGLLYAGKKDARAGQYYTTALRIDPGNLRALYARGIYYQEVDSTNLAIMDYGKILAIAPDFLSTNLNLGYIYLQRKEYDKAVQYFTAAIDNNPSQKEAYEYRSQAYRALNKPDLAKADADKAKEIEKNKEKDQK